MSFVKSLALAAALLAVTAAITLDTMAPDT